jgi:hypothetical protein
MKRSLLVLVSAAAMSLGVAPAWGQAMLSRMPPSVFHTQKADIVYDHRTDLEELARKLGAIGPGSPPSADLGRLSDLIDGMLSEISRVLQKWPTNPVRLTIRLLRDGFQVQQQQMALRTPPPPRPPQAPRYLQSYYEPRLRTIFLSLADARIGLLAHEMTHFILLESPGARTSEEYQESLARYMEERFNAGK